MRWSGALAIVALASVASAQDHVILPPHPIDVTVPYPAAAHGNAVVVFELVLGPDGHVLEWRILEGAEPFLEAAKQAVAGFTFAAATRDGRPVAARIRVEIPFHEQLVAPTARVEVVDVVRPKPKPEAVGPKDVEDVRIRGVRKELGGTTMTKEEVRDMPGAFGDAFRAIDMMPGVTPIISGLPFFFIRGAPPGNTGYFVDDVRVPLLYHVAVGPSVIHPSLIDRVDFYPGGFPAQYGRFTGGIVNGETRGPSGRLTGEAELRLYDAGVLGEAPFDSGKGDVLVAGRYGYPGPLVSLFAPTTQLGYWDYQGRISYRVAPRDTLTAFVFGSFDELDQCSPVYDTQGHQTSCPFYPLIRTEFHRADLRWDRAVHGGNLRTALTLGIDDSLVGGTGSNPADADHVQAQSVQLRTQLDQTLTKTLRVRTGADVLLYHYDYTGSEDGVPVPFPTRNDVMFGAYGDVVWRVHPRIEIVPGLRFDVFTSRSEGTLARSNPLSLVTGNDRAVAVPALDPRLAARVTISSRLTWVGTLGLTHQPPSFVAPVPGAELGSLSNGLQTAVQASQGFEAKLPLDIELKGTFFIQDYFDMSNALATCTGVFNDLPSVNCLDERVNGRSLGLEILLRRSFSKRVAGWVSYTLSRSTVEVPHPHRGEPSEVPSNFDRPNVLNAVLAFDFGKGYHAGARFTYYTGLPYTQTAQGVPVPPYDGYRLPDFWRFDIRLEKRWRLGTYGQFAVVLEGLNITFNKEALAATCQPVQGQYLDKCTAQTIGPVSVPSLGIEAKY